MNETYITLRKQDLSELKQLASDTRDAIYHHMQYDAAPFSYQYEAWEAGRPKPSLMKRSRNLLFDYSPDAPEASVSPIAALDVFHMIGRLEMSAIEHASDSKGELFARMASTLNQTAAVRRLRTEYARLSEHIGRKAGDSGDWRGDAAFFEAFERETYPPSETTGPREPIWRRLATRRFEAIGFGSER